MRKLLFAFPMLALLCSAKQEFRKDIIAANDSASVACKLVRYVITNDDTVMQAYTKKWNDKFAAGRLPDIYYVVPKTNIKIALPKMLVEPTRADKIDVKTIKSADPNLQGKEYDQNFTVEHDSLGRVNVYSGTGCKGCTYTPFEYHYTWSANGKLLLVNSIENVNIIVGGETTVVQNEILRMKLKYDDQGRLSEIVYAEDQVQGWRLYFTY